MGKSIKKKNKEPKKEKSSSKDPKKQKGVKGIIRIAGSDVFGEVPLNKALLKVKGIGHTIGSAISKVIASKLGVANDIQVGDLNEKQLEELDGVLSNISEYVPTYLLNRRKDPNEGTNKHVITNDLIFATRQDIEKHKKLYSWKGYRHAYGKKVRGQRTRNTGRHGGALGVVRKSLQQQKKSSTTKSAPAKKK